MTIRRNRPAYWKAVRAIARAIARNPELGCPTIRPSFLSGRIADLDGGNGGFRSAFAWACAMDDILCIEVTPAGPDVPVWVTGRLSGFSVRLAVTELQGRAFASRCAEITVAELEALAAESGALTALIGAGS